MLYTKVFVLQKALLHVLLQLQLFHNTIMPTRYYHCFATHYRYMIKKESSLTSRWKTICYVETPW